MPIAARHRDDPVPDLTPLDGFAVHGERSAAVMAALQARPVDEIARRFELGHRAYVANLNGAPAAWGWVATRSADIGELLARVELPDGERYLWNFVTRTEYRGRGIYPRLLEAIVRAESREATRFWIAHAPENHASAAGIRKAGFVPIAELSFDRDGRPALASLLPGGADVASRVIALRQAAAPLAPCWRCVRAGRAGRGTNMHCPDGACRCDYQVAESGCAA